MRIYLLNCLVTGLPFVKLLCGNVQIAGVISVKAEGASSITEYYDMEQFCLEQKIEYVTVETYSLKSENDKNKLLNLSIDLIIVSAWQRLVPEWLIKHCNMGIIGAHGSSIGIEGGRGRSPQNWSLILGQDRFYVSIFWIDANIDSGEIIDTKEFEYELIDDISTSYHKVAICLAEMVIENLRNGNIVNHYGVRQRGEIGYLPKRTSDDGMIDWKRTCREVYDFVRALTVPYPCAYTKVRGHIIKIIRCKYIRMESLLLGQYSHGEVIMILDSSSFWVKCSDGIIEILEYANEEGIEIKEGDIFEECDFKEQMRRIIERHNIEVGLPISSMLWQYVE